MVVAMTQADITISFEEICERGRIAREAGDNSKWELGQLANAVMLDARYGEHRMRDFALNCNVQHRSMQQYRQTFERFGDCELRYAEGLSWSHFRIATRFTADSAAYDFLNRAASNLWTVDQASIEAAALLGKGKRMALVLDATDVHIVSIGGNRVTLEMDTLDAQDLVMAFYGETKLEVKVYQEMSE